MLRAIVEKIDDIEEGLRGHYKERDGKYVLDVEEKNGWSLEDVGALKRGLASERERMLEARKRLEPFGVKWSASKEEFVDGDDLLDAKKARDALKKVATFSKIDPEKEAGRLATEQIEVFKAQMVEDHQAAMGKVNSKLSARDTQLAKIMIENDGRKALEKHKGNAEILLPLIRERTRFVENDDGSVAVRVLDEKGNPRIGGDSQYVTVESLVGEMSENPSLMAAFEGTGHSGGGTPAGGRRGPGGPMTYTEEQIKNMPQSQYKQLRSDGKL